MHPVTAPAQARGHQLKECKKKGCEVIINFSLNDWLCYRFSYFILHFRIDCHAFNPQHLLGPFSVVLLLPIPLEILILMCPSNSVLSATRNILSSTEEINGTYVYCPIAFDRDSARTDFDNLGETLKSYASQREINCVLL